jgi:hypothetical protein
MYYFYEDGINVRTDSVTKVWGGGLAYNAALSAEFSDESTTEPVTLQEAKNWCRVDINDDDAIITALITAARIVCENYANLSFIERTVTAKIHNGLGNITLPFGPVVGDITSITDIYDTPLTDYTLQTPYGTDLTVVYDAGYATLPENFKTAILCQIAWMYENRGDAGIAVGLSELSKLLLKQIREV